VKNAAGAVVSTVAVQSDADGSSLAFANGTYAVKTVAPATAGALSTITFGGATINNADATTNNTAAAAPAAAAVVAGTAVINELPVITVPTTPVSALVGSTPNNVSGVSFTDADDNTGFTATVKASGTSQVAFSNVYTAIVKDSTGGLLGPNQGSNTVTVTGTKSVVQNVLGALTYISNASIAGAETATVTVTDAKGGSATSTINIAVAKQLTLATTTVTANLTGTANDDQFSGSLADFSRYTSPYSVVGAGGNDKLILSSVNGDVAGLASGISALELTLTGNSTLTVSTSKFASSLTTVNATGNYTLGGTFNSGTTFNIAALASAATNGLTITNLLVPSTSVASAVTTDAVTVNLTTTTAGDTTLASITDTARTIDVLNINSNGSVANVIGTINPLATNATVNIAGAKDLTITTALPALGTGKVDASTFTGKLKLTTDAASTTVLGGSAADSITGGAGTDSITGNAGNDSIVGSNGSDTLSGGAGDDTLTGGTDIDSILGGDGADSITSNNGNDFLYGEAGNDTINGGTGSDSIDGGADADSITGGGGSDTLVGGAGNDTIVGGAGVDAITGGTGADVLTGGITGVNTYTFTLGDSGNTAATRDQITDLKTGDIIKFGGYGITGLTTGANLGTSASSLTAKEVYVDQVNNRIVIETAVDGTTTEEIVIPSSVGKASFTYNYGADSVVGTADDYLTVGYAPLTKTNDGLGKLTLVGNTVADIYVNIQTNQSPTVAGDTISGGIIRSLDTSAVTGGAISIVGSTGNDSIIGSALSDSINGAEGNDLITLGAGADSVVITATTGGTDTITDFVGGTDYLTIGASTTAQVFAVTSVAGGSATYASGIAGDGTLYINGATLSNGTAVTGAETITGSAGTDSIVGGAGSDTIDGGAGNDVINGGAGNDSITGGSAGTDSIYGGDGDDYIITAGTKAYMSGDAGNDSIVGSAGSDTIDGGSGNDTITGGTGGSDSISGGDGNDSIIGGALSDTIDGGAGNDSITGGSGGSDSISGGDGNDTITGGALSDTISGGSGDDVITGGAGSDSIVGGDGADTITGDAGADALTGGLGIDIFVAGTDGSIAGTALDTISDFNTGGSDIIRLAGTVVVPTSGGTAVATSAVAVATGGLVTFDSADDTYAEKVTALQADTAKMGAGKAVLFVDGSDTYVFFDGATTGTGDDQIIKLTGVSGTSFDTITVGTTTTDITIG
jgi:Ca2+-binding RTX toxin-like protein